MVVGKWWRIAHFGCVVMESHKYDRERDASTWDQMNLTGRRRESPTLKDGRATESTTICVIAESSVILTDGMLIQRNKQYENESSNLGLHYLGNMHKLDNMG